MINTLKLSQQHNDKTSACVGTFTTCMYKCACADRQIFWPDNPLPITRMESCQALQGFLLNQNPDYVARIAVVSPAGSLLTLAPALSAHRYFRKKTRAYTS